MALVAASGGLPATAGAVVAVFGQEAERWALWLPVAMGAGAAGYFQLAVEPSPWVAGLTLTAVVAAALAFHRRPVGLLAAAGSVAIALGFAVAQLSAMLAEAPRVERRVGPVQVEARIVRVSPREAGARLLVEPSRIERWPGRLPDRLRISVPARQSLDGMRPGAVVRLRAILLPLPPPAAPGAFDFPRQAWFQRLGGLGFAVGTAAVEPGPLEADGWRDRLERLRHDLTERIRDRIGGGAGAVAAALVTGERGAIPEEVNVAMRDTGLAHLLSISGLHIGLVAGIVFGGLRFLMALVPPLALRLPVKKLAAVGAVAGAFFYLLLSGADVPTQRAFLMATIVFLGVVVDREAITLRLIAWAALAILLLAPEAVIGASFQMSFAAVVALVAAYEASRERIRRWRAEGSVLAKAALYLGLVAMTTLVATAATTPFALYHFNRFAAFALPANLVAVPLTSLWVMPWAVIAAVLMPLGLEGWPLDAMGWGVEAMLVAARWIAGWPGAVLTVPAMPAWGLAAICFGGLWLCLWRGPVRRWGLPAMALGFASIAFERPPDLLVDAEARAVAIRGPTGYWIHQERKAPIPVETWLRRAAADAVEIDGGGSGQAAGCDDRVCRFRTGGERIAVVRHRAALTEACRSSDIVIALVPMRWDCGRGVLAIDRNELERSGAHAVWFRRPRPIVETVAERRGLRPWSAPPVAVPERGQ
ncbi:MAG: ComEC/Rec2 family competence protein [Alphaproteobacteria bacterium]